MPRMSACDPHLPLSSRTSAASLDALQTPTPHRVSGSVQLKAAGIHLSWEGIRRALAGQDRVTVTLKRADGKTVHIRKTTRAEPRQQAIYDELEISDRPGRTEKTIT